MQLLLTHCFLPVFTGYSPVVTVDNPFNFDVDCRLHSHSNLLQVCQWVQSPKILGGCREVVVPKQFRSVADIIKDD